MTKIRGGGGGGGGREQKMRQGPGVTSGLGGRGDLRRSSLGSCGENVVADPKQTNKTRTIPWSWMASMKVCLVIVFICSNRTSAHPEIDSNCWRIDI